MSLVPNNLWKTPLPDFDLCRYFVAALSVACLYSIITMLASLSVVSKPASAKRLLLYFAFWDVVSFLFPYLIDRADKITALNWKRDAIMFDITGDVGDRSIGNWGIGRGGVYRIKGQRPLEMDKDMQRLRQVLQTYRQRHRGLTPRRCSSRATLHALLLLPLLAHSWLTTSLFRLCIFVSTVNCLYCVF